jgi:hypothetical protein
MYAHHNYYRNLNVDAQVSGREERESMSTPHPPRLTGRCPGCRRPIPCGCHLRIGRRLSWHYRVLPAAAWAIGSSNATAVTPPPLRGRRNVGFGCGCVLPQPKGGFILAVIHSVKSVMW